MDVEAAVLGDPPPASRHRRTLQADLTGDGRAIQEQTLARFSPARPPTAGHSVLAIGFLE